MDQLKAQLALKDQHRAGHAGAGFTEDTGAAVDGTTASHFFGELRKGWPDKGGGRSKGENSLVGGRLEQDPDRPLLAVRHGGDSPTGHGWAFAAAGSPQRGDEPGAGDDADAGADSAATPSEGSSDGSAAGAVEGEAASAAPRYHSLPSDSSDATRRCGTGAAQETHGGGNGESSGGCRSRNLCVDFERFKNERGLHVNSRLQDAKAAVRRARSLVSDLAGRVNKAKSRIDSSRAQLQQQQRERGGEEEQGVIEPEGGGEWDEGEEANVRRVLVAQLKRRKREYRRLFALLAEAKADLRGLQQNKQQVPMYHGTYVIKACEKFCLTTSVLMITSPPASPLLFLQPHRQCLSLSFRKI